MTLTSVLRTPSVLALQAFGCALALTACGDDTGGSGGSGGGAGGGTTSTSATTTTTTTTTSTGSAGGGGAGGEGGGGEGGGGEGGSGEGGGGGGEGGGGEGGSGEGGGGGGSASACFDGGMAVSPTSSAGTCNQPIAINLNGATVGDVSTFTIPGTMGAQSANTWFEGGTCGVTGFDAATRYVVFSVDVGSATALEVSVDAAAGANPLVGVAEDPSCMQPLNACADDGALGQCEFVRAEKGGAGYFGTSTYVIVADAATSNAEMTVRFRLGAP